MRFIHLADLHLDAAFQSRSRTVRGKLRDAARGALAAAVDEALSRRVDAVLIAGDLFDGERLSVQTERFLGEVLTRLSEGGVQVVYATGNHDPGGTTEAARRFAWPHGVTFVGGPEPVRVDIVRNGEIVGRVTAAGHAEARVTDDLSRAFPAPEGPVPEVALLHTQVRGASGASGHEPYAPSELSALSRAGFDYWALGHVHTRQALAEVPAIHYAGNTQGLNPRETGPRGGLFVQLQRGEPAQPEFLELGPVRWETLAVSDLQGESDLAGVATRIERQWEEARSADPGMEDTRWILRVELVGTSEIHRDWKTPEATEELAEALGPSLDVLDLEIRTERLTPVLRAEECIGREDVLGEALRLLADLQTEDGASPSEILGLAREDLLGLGPDSRDDVDVYLRQLLSEAETSLLETLLDTEKGR